MKDLAATKAKDATEIKTACADFATGLAIVTAQIKDMHTRWSVDIQTISRWHHPQGSHKANQATP